MYNFKKEHSINVELDEVHKRMIRKYTIKKQAKLDVQRAKKMEQYLRKFKNLNNYQNFGKSTIQQELENQGIQEIIRMVGQTLGINSYFLFKNRHHWYLDSQKRWEADDVFEAELMTFLNIALDKAVINQATSLKGKAELIGNLPGNIGENFIKEVIENKDKLNQDANIDSEYIKPPTFKSAKIDVTGYSASINVESEIKPEWQEFVKIFQGAKFTVKNYSSTAKTEVIHLGNSVLFKAIVGELDELGFNPKQASHIYYHSIGSYNKNNTNKNIVGSHINHMRFAYELSGGGLYDMEGNRLDAADFFIYNDPATNNIWVKSTKEMIANAMEYIDNNENSIHSNIVILKQAFI